MESKKPRIAHCGLGQWGPNLLRNVVENSGLELAALCDADENRLKDFAARYGVGTVYTDVAQISEDISIDAVILATPAGLHEEHVRMLLAAGKDVLVEKPLAFSAKVAASLVKEAETLGRVLMVGHTFLFNEAVRRVKVQLDRGTLGRLQFVSMQRLSLGSVRSDCNALWNLAPHDISILLYWLGELPLSISARGIAFNPGHQQEDLALCVLEFPGNILVSIHVGWLNPVKIRQITLVGADRMLVYDDVNDEMPLTLYDQGVQEVEDRSIEGTFKGFRLQVRRGPLVPLPVESREPLATEIEHFRECLLNRRLPIGSGMDAVKVCAVLEACDLSLKKNGAPISPASLLP